jgi:hypothetical protein
MTRIASSILLMVMTFTPAVAQPQFDRHWYDGKAELDGYRLVVSRYGENRSGTAVMVFVTEPFSESMRVKMDDADANPGDTFTALKLNLVRDFQTGVYDYNTMVSVFARAETMEPVKVSFSSAEWCGQTVDLRSADNECFVIAGCGGDFDGVAQIVDDVDSRKAGAVVGLPRDHDHSPPIQRPADRFPGPPAHDDRVAHRDLPESP